MMKLKRTLDNFLFLLKPAMKYGKTLFIMMLLVQTIPTVASSLVGVATPKLAIDGIVNGKPVLSIITSIAVLLLVQLILQAISTGVSYGTQARQNEFSLKFTKLIVERAIVTDFRYLDKPEYYAKYQLAYQQFGSSSQNVFHMVIQFVSSLMTCAALFTVISMLGPWVVLIVVAGTLIQTLFNMKLVKFDTEVSKTLSNKSRGINYGSRMLSERQYAADMKSGNMGKYVLGWVDKYTGFIVDLLKASVRPRIRITVLTSIFNHLTTLGTIAYVVWGISAGKIGSIGDYAALIAASGTLSGQLNSLFSLVTDMARVSMQAEQAREFFDLPSTIEQSSGEALPDTPLSVEFEDVSFAYPEAEFCLENLSFKIAPGEKVAIVGENGAGKSTVTKLLLRLYDADKGCIRINGQPISHWDVHKLRERVGIAFQDANVYAMSLRQNMQYYYPDADDETRLRALREVGLERLTELDKTISREFVDDGIMLSGGEAQKLALARLLVGSFGLMILDEPSSSLDPLAEYKMTKLMFEAGKSTTIMVAHRLSTVRDADRIYLIDGGRLAEQGTHRELMELNGKYAEMFHKQAENYVK